MKRNLLFLPLLAGCFCFFQVQAQNTSPYWSLAGNSNADGASKLGTTTLTPVRIFSNNLERMRITSEGKVVIGIRTATGKFTLHNNGTYPAASWVTSGAPIFTSFAEATGGNADHILAMASNTSTARPNMVFRRSRGTLETPTVIANNDFLASLAASGFDGTAFQNPATVDFFVDGAPSAGNVPARISFSTGSNLGNRTERLTVKSNGNVGIGTTSPVQKLHVAGNQYLGGNLYFGTGSNFIQFANPVASGPAMMYMLQSGTANAPRMVLSHSPSYPDWGLQYVDDGDYFNFLGSGSSAMVVRLGSGNVGIGTINPTYRLSVNGTIRAKEVRVESGWADYVFEDGYKLRPLSEVAAYIKANRRLPGMVSAKEVQENGLAVAETQTKMMEKIEELTLYVIALQKQLDELKAQQATNSKPSAQKVQ